MNRQRSAMAIRGTEQVEGDCPHCGTVEIACAGFAPVERAGYAADRGFISDQNYGAGEQVESQIKRVEIVAAEGGEEDSADLIEVARDLKFFGGAANRQIVYENLRLVEGAVGDAGEFSEFEVAEVLHADPDTDSDHGEYEAQRASGRPEQEEAQHREDRGNAVENDHDLAVRHSVLQELVVDVLTVSGEDGASTDEAADH